MVKGILVSLAAADLLLLAFSAYMGGGWVANTQVAFVTSALVLGASMLSYARMVRSRIEAGAIPYDSRDMIDKMDDPHDLYSDDAPKTVQENKANAAAIKEAIKEEKQRMKGQRRSPLEVLRDSRASMSIYRLGAYVLLVFGFFYLNGNKLLQPLPYLIGLGIPVAVVVVSLMKNKEVQ